MMKRVSGESSSTNRKPVTLGVLLSGGGRTMLNLHEHIERGALDARIGVVVSSRSDAAGVGRARAAGHAVEIIERNRLGDEAFHQRVSEAVSGCDLVCMAGFLSLWRIPPAMAGRVINIHPALLPDFGGRGMYGMRVHRAVLEAGRKQSGCTVHFCDNEYDHGPVILQRTVPVLPEDTPEQLAERVFEQECVAYPEAITLFAQGRIEWKAGAVRVAR
jgi:formyltetrahydrofolate-dependent phosphoribosylglycinamide formyltransferase